LQVWLSGGVVLTPTWKEYYVNASSWTVVQGVNADQNGSGSFVLNTTQTWQECEAQCQAHAGCNVWTWHDANQGKYAFDCYVRTDGQWNVYAQSGHISGRCVHVRHLLWGGGRKGATRRAGE
jgi:hypothetical protein